MLSIMMLSPHYREGLIEAGCDEAGRGCLAGPVFAAAVILPDDYRNPDIDDSKKLNMKMREILRQEIEEKAVTWAIGSSSVEEIDRLNILNASYLAMHRAIQNLSVVPQHLIIDGNRFKPCGGISHSCIVKGDGQYMSIAAASILAKTYRDRFMKQIAQEYPVYLWDQNKGYATKEHRDALAKYGTTRWHRKSFFLREQQMSFSFPDFALE
jgi:ribonuclease HII